MKKTLSTEELEKMILRLCDDGALELIRGGKGVIFIPFIMNDALEAYCTLTDTIIPGALPDDVKEATDVQIARKEERNGIILKNKETVLTTLWYGSCVYEEHFYQYHRIMHCWARGDEHMRMLVYMVGTIRDKYECLGDKAVTELEKSLLPLMEYRPFRFFSPIKESIDDWYPDTKEGFMAMQGIVKEAGDKKLLRLMRAGKLFGKILDRRISKRMARSDCFFEFLYGKICEASRTYEQRSYHSSLEETIPAQRKMIHAQLLDAGYAGEYPSYRKGRSEILVFEEHPFTVDEMDNMAFSLHLLEHVPDDLKHPFRVVTIEDIRRN